MYYLGIDLGGTNTVCGIIDEKGRIIAKNSIKTQSYRAAEDILDNIVTLCNQVTKDTNIPLSNIKWAGLGSPGSVDSKCGIIKYANNVNFKDMSVGAYLSERLNMDVYIENDANCAALGESISGSAKGYINSLTVTLGTGIGGGIIIDGKIYSGTYGIGGEIGHHVIQYNGRKCTCGRKGCFEAYASATGLINSAKEAVAKNPESKIIDLVGSVTKITAKSVFEAAQLQDQTAIELLNVFMEYLGCGLANLIDILDPEIIVIGGGISAQGENLLAPLRQKVKAMAYADAGMKVKIAISALGNDAGMIGASMLGLGKQYNI